MAVTILQAFLIILLSGIRALDYYSTQTFPLMHVLFCWLAGIILGDPYTGLVVGGTIQLMSMGAVGLGGSSAPDYGMAGLVATVIAITTGNGDISVGLTVGIAVAMLYVQLDVLFKIYNSWVFRIMRGYAEKREYDKMLRSFFLSHLYLFLQGALPMAIVIFFGQPAVETILAIMPEWFTKGLNVAAGILPCTGFAVLLTFMPLKKFWAFVVAGFVCAAWLRLPILPIALIGMIVAVCYFKLHTEGVAGSQVATATDGGELEDE